MFVEGVDLLVTVVAVTIPRSALVVVAEKCVRQVYMYVHVRVRTCVCSLNAFIIITCMYTSKTSVHVCVLMCTRVRGHIY